MIEHERSYIFTHEGLYSFLDSCGLQINNEQSLKINDYYLNLGKRIRYEKDLSQLDGKEEYILVKKTGNKADGYRFEEEICIQPEAAALLIEDAHLHVSKMRHIVKDDDGYLVIADFIESPMKLAVLEVEAKSESVYPVAVDIVHKLFDRNLRECPLSTWQLFRRKIGICGGPSCGKTETAKFISHKLNTDFQSNSWHVTEFATSFIQKYNRHPSFYDQFVIWYGQREREENASKADIVISDCPTFLSYIYCTIIDRPVLDKKSAFLYSKMYKRALFDLTDYTDIIFMNLANYKDNNIRYQSHEEALSIQQKIKEFLDMHRITYCITDYTHKEQIIRDLFYINQ